MPVSRWGRGWIGLAVALAGLAPIVDRGARAQEPGAPPPASAPGGATQDLSLRYRFVERYGLSEDLGRPDQLVQYQVGTFETIRREVEQPRGAPERQEITHQTIYTERPARLGKLGEVTDTIRRYDLFRTIGAGQVDVRPSGLLKGLLVWYHPRSTGFPELISLTPDRPVRQLEYDIVLGQIFSPRLTAVLPPRPVLLKDQWPISRQAARVMMGQVPEAGDFRLEGTLTRVDPAAQGTAMTAIIDVEGELDFNEGAGAVRARLWFVFEPIRLGAEEATQGVAGPSTKRTNPRDAAVVEARGYVAKLVMSLSKTLPLDEQGRLQQVETGELQLQRRPMPVQAEGLTIPETPPTPDETNSWLVFDDPRGRFHFRHPQSLEVRFPDPGSEDIHMIQPLPNGKSDVLVLTPVPKDRDPAVDRRRNDPQAFSRDLKDQWEHEGFELVQGPAGWLPDQEWAPLKRRVYRVQTAIKPDERAKAPRGAARVYLDAYQVLFTRGETFYVKAMTDRDDHVAFRDQAEKLIKTLDLGPSAPGLAGATAPRPASAPPAAAAPPADLPTAPPVPRLNRRP